MAFSFDSSVGGTTANSYISVSDADDYFAGRYGSDLYTALSDADKQALLVTATKRIDREKFADLKLSQSQSLQFPRNYTPNRDGYTYPTDEIPAELQNAVCEYAYFLLQQDDRTLSELELHDAPNLTNFSVGPLSYGFRGNAKADRLPEAVKLCLQRIGPGVWIYGNPNSATL